MCKPKYYLYYPKYFYCPNYYKNYYIYYEAVLSKQTNVLKAAFACLSADTKQEKRK